MSGIVLKRAGTFLVLIFGLLAAAGPARAQDAPASRTSLVDPTQPNLLLNLQGRLLEARAQGSLLVLEGPVDPATYIVGPGDQFGISVGGALGMNQVLPVSASGELILPQAGSVDAEGRTLAEVETLAETMLRRQFRNVPIEVTLAQPRSFLVHVSGVVPDPGRFVMLPRSRVDDALQQASLRAATRLDPATGKKLPLPGTVSTERPEMDASFHASLRNVVLRHVDGTEERLDLLRYYTTGDMTQNPYLFDGDVIEVPGYHVERDGVRVSGEIPFPGSIDFRPGDTALDVLVIVAGPNGLGELKEVRLTRRAPDGIEHHLLDVPAILAGTTEDMPLRPGDHLNVLTQERAFAAMYGLVEYPGTYPIRDGETTLRELIAMAGGLKPDANPREAFIERRKSLAFKENPQVSDLDFFSRAYFQSQLGQNRVVIDLENALREGADDVLIYDQDRVVFPRDEGVIFVTGNVPQPGYVTFEQGRDAGYYIAQTGGLGPAATDVYVFSPTGPVRKGRGNLIRPGDTIFVDREDIAENPEIAALLLSSEASQRQSRIMTTQTIITGVSAITSIITAYVAIRSINN